jgi:hypothetical protein
MSRLSIYVLPSTRRKLPEEIECLVPDRGYAPEQKLCSKMIMIAGLDLLNRKAKANYQDAYQWVFNEDPLNEFAFSRLCEEIGLEPEAVREFYRRLVDAKDPEKKELGKMLRRAFRLESGLGGPL